MKMEAEPNKLYLVDDSGKLIVEKQPHIRIDIDDINGVPKVFIDGVDVTDGEKNHTALQHLNVNWETNSTKEMPKSYDIQLCDIKNHCKIGYAQSNYLRHRVITLKYAHGIRKVAMNSEGDFVDIYDRAIVPYEEVKHYEV
ncbi:hypothetical protein [Liquorilactobacillus nagelii]|uniref:hypothetical protein n=1 Tax=Liquorilactobacillus nagelii TaxID=82688 RepID=UPI0039EBD94B